MICDFILELNNPPKDMERFLELTSNLYPYLCQENKKSNLTRILSEEDYWIKHVADSILLLNVLPELTTGEISLADLGCGAGFPSLIIAIAAPNCSITAIDSIGKKCDFVSRAGTLLELNNLNVITGRGRELSAKKEFLGKFDIITARAVSEAKKIFREVRRMLKPNGTIILFKTPEAAEIEICDLRKISKNFKWTISRTYQLPKQMGSRCFLIGRKL